MARINFNPEQTRPFSGSSPVFPSGDYVVEITNEEERDFQSGAGKGLTLDYRIVDGEFKGMIVRDVMNLLHPSPKASEIAQRRLVAIAHGHSRTPPQAVRRPSFKGRLQWLGP